MRLIYHITSVQNWETARSVGESRESTRGRRLEDVGFIHASQASQVEAVANAFYRGEAGLLVLVIDEDRLVSPVRYERVPDADLPFPHIYGPLNADAVITTLPLCVAEDGTFTWSPPDNVEPCGPEPGAIAE